jgi:L-ascorbate metabolism protein UlaG (beta-lactamase superfamily)
MKIKWLGHATFLITSDSGTSVMTDPYATSADIKYGPINEAADIVTVSHEHHDHNNVSAVKGSPQVVRGSAEVKGIKIKGIPAYHDASQGSQRGSNTIFCFEMDGVNICHLGDLGHPLSEAQAASLGKVDVLLIPVGGFFTIDAKAAGQVAEQLKPRVIIPMHYKTDKLNFPIKGVADFLQGKKNVSRLDASEVVLKKGELPTSTQIMVLKPAL